MNKHKEVGHIFKPSNLKCGIDEVLSHLLSEIGNLKTCLTTRLTSLELKVSVLVETCSKISSKVDAIEHSGYRLNRENFDSMQGSNEALGTIDDNLNTTGIIKEEAIRDNEEDIGSRLKLVPMSSVSDYPGGSWLGNPQTPTERVRCQITHQNLFYIHSVCFTAEKMALTLLDNLFSREQLAVSNISGRSRWGKRRLNPLLIYGIHVHLKYKFGITDKEWRRICQNIDAKCRFASRRTKRINRSVTSKSKLKVHNQHIITKERASLDRLSAAEDMNFDFENLNSPNMDFNNCVEVITESPYELRILNSTPTQIAHLHDTQEIILAEEMQPDSNDSKSIMIDSTSQVSMNNVVIDHSIADDGLGSDLTISHVESLVADDSKADRPSHADSHQESLTIHDSRLEDGLQLEVELNHEDETEDGDGHL